MHLGGLQRLLRVPALTAPSAAPSTLTAAATTAATAATTLIAATASIVASTCTTAAAPSSPTAPYAAASPLTDAATAASLLRGVLRPQDPTLAGSVLVVGLRRLHRMLPTAPTATSRLSAPAATTNAGIARGLRQLHLVGSHPLLRGRPPPL